MTIITHAIDGVDPATANPKFLAHIYRGGHWAHLWTDAGKKSHWFGVNGNSESHPMPEPDINHNVYMSVHPCAQIPPQNNSGNTDKQYIRVQDEYIECINHLYAEFDAKDYVAESEYKSCLPDDFDNLSGARKKVLIKKAKESAFYADVMQYKLRALDAIGALSIQPSVIKDSGGGYHCYWFLRDSVPVNDDNREEIRRIQAGWVDHVGGDRGAKDLARILRLAGTYNHKKGFGDNPPMVAYVKSDFGLFYSYAELAQRVPQPTREKPQSTTSVVQNTGKEARVITEYNVRHRVEDSLVKYGYTQIGSNRWSRPDQPDSGGVVVLPKDNKTYHYSGNDDLDSDHGGKQEPRSPFDYFRIYEHGGVYKSAVMAAALELGMDYQSREQRLLESFRTVDTETGEVIEKEITPENIIAEIESIGGDIGQVRERLAVAVGAVDRSSHVEIEAALVEHCKLTKTDAKAFTAACRSDAKERKKAAAARRREEINERRITDRGDRPAIQPNNRQLRDVVDDTMAAMSAATAGAEPIMYQRGGVLCRNVNDESGAMIQNIDEAAMSGILSNVCDFVEVSSNADGDIKETEVYPPQRLAKTILSLGIWPDIPHLQAVTQAPTLAPDGTLHTEGGYNPATQLYHAQPVTLGDTEPTAANVERAKLLILDDLLGDFPFKDDASRAHAIALTILPIVRPYIQGQTPLHLIDAPMPGTGKGLLTDVCAMPATGRSVPAMQAGRDDDEWRKRLTASALIGGTHTSIDNITDALDSGVLASFLTQDTIEDRILGTSKTVRLKIRNIWVANGNNVSPSDEIARRCVWIRLDANAEKPWERDGFKHPQLKQWILSNRGEILTAILTLVNKWVADGMPKFSGKAKGSYSEWSDTIGGILESVGIGGFLENEAELYESSVGSNDQWTAFVEAWKDKFGQAETASADLFKLASYTDDVTLQGGEYLNLLSDELGAGKDRSRQIKLGKKLQQKVDRVVAGCKIQKGGIIRGKPQWRLMVVEQPTSVSENTKTTLIL